MGRGAAGMPFSRAACARACKGDVEMMNVETMLQEGARLKAEIAAATERLRQINQAVAGAAQFKDGAKTGHVVAGGVRAKVSLRDNVRWDQERLLQLRQFCPEAFERAFKAEFKPASAKGLQEAMAMDAGFAEGVEWARTVSPGAPQVDYEILADEGEGVANAA